MALTKIFTGMELGPEAIDANFKAVTDNIVITAWTNTGVTFLNGFTSDTGSGSFMYRTIDIGDTHTLEICGWVKTPKLTKSQKITALRIPASVMGTGKRVDFNKLCWWGDRWASLDINTSTGEINLTNMDTNDTPAGGISFNARFSW